MILYLFVHYSFVFFYVFFIFLMLRSRLTVVCVLHRFLDPGRIGRRVTTRDEFAKVPVSSPSALSAGAENPHHLAV